MSLRLSKLIEQEQDIKLVAFTMTVDLLGLQKEELLDEVEYAGERLTKQMRKMEM